MSVHPKLKNKIPVSVIVVTRNEEACIAKSLDALCWFDDLWVVDSNSNDRTCDIARECGARVANFDWDGKYPKKRQWCLDHLPLRNQWVFFVDADEIVTNDLTREIAALDLSLKSGVAGYFVRGRYLWPYKGKHKMLRYGLGNNKLVLFDRWKVEFPVVDDLGLGGMGEIEGHYQPILKDKYAGEMIRQLNFALEHAACESKAIWYDRHERYAQWEAGMNIRDAWPKDPVQWRQAFKQIFRAMPMRNVAAFLHCYILKLGFLDGGVGLDFALSRAWYYKRISEISKTSKGAVQGSEIASLITEKR